MLQVLELFPSARELNCTWTNVVKLGQSLYREGPGLDQYRPTQRTPIPNFFMAGSYTYQVRTLPGDNDGEKKYYFCVRLLHSCR